MLILGACIYKAESNDEKQMLMVFGVVLFAFMPIVYRYLPTIKLVADEQAVIMPLFAAMVVPVGITFFVLGAISYVMDIYMGKAMPGNITDVFVFTMLFPKSLCGPVILWRDFSRQVNKRRTGINRISFGIKRIIIGYAKKAIIADTFAAQISFIDIKMSVNSIDSASVWILGILYFFRIYYDFSGYSDIAIGLCSIFGFDIGENFDQPYLSESLTDFWRKWHISLGRWFREYIYIPLGGSRTGNLYLNILITFIVAALWHGWTFNLLLWGILNGLIVIAEKKFVKKERPNNKKSFAGLLFTMTFIFFGWMLFRAPDLASAGEVFRALVISPGGDLPNFTWKFFLTKRIVVFLAVAATDVSGVLKRGNDFLKKQVNPTVYDVTEKIMLLVLFALDIMFVLGTAYTPFIYSLIP
jgi:alginate O-acetyltransferase complex protein AlgI